MSQPLTLAIFCKVVDNYGDIGICWRFCKQLHHEHSVAPTLWVDDLHSFKKICPSVQTDLASQSLDGVHVRHWSGQDGDFDPADVADIVIEFFAVDIPPGYVEAMAQRERKPVWLNFEGLSAEEWVEGCHTLPSMHPRLPLTKFFFFPGFTSKTGGLLRERGLGEDFATVSDGSFRVSLFCYPHAPVVSLLEQWRDGVEPVTCFVPEGVAADAVAAFIGTHGALTLKVIPFLPQPEYDRLLWSCDLNFVRGEDSFVRAQWARKPFVWHIYPQDEQLHHKKLRAFLGKYAAALPALTEFSLAWNGALPCAPDWTALRSECAQMTVRAREWEAEMRSLGDFTSNLLAFARSRM
jgi:uncharacterized repeat protein (TIGR03837 family)